MTPVSVITHRAGHGHDQENKPFRSTRSDSDRRNLPSERERVRGGMPSREERSLSPYSKRIALTQAMNMER